LFTCSLILYITPLTEMFYRPITPLIEMFYRSLQIKEGFAEGKDLVVSVMSSMGEEQINALKDIGPKN